MLNTYKILLYDEDTMEIFQGLVKSVSCTEPEYTRCETLNDYRYQTTIPITPMNMELVALVTDKVIELDQTTMKRIAKYNKTTELEQLNSDIKKAKCELKQLKKDINTQVTKLDSLKEFMSNFIDTGYSNVDEYCENKYCNDEYEFDY